MSYRKQILDTYTGNAAKFAAQYDTIDTAQTLSGITERLPTFHALDLGCGNGRDAHWLAEQGFTVDAIDGSEGLLNEAKKCHAHKRVTYHHDLLPEMNKIRAKGQKYDMIVLSAVWMHMKPADREAALRHILEVAKPGAVIFISLRHGTSPADRPMFEVSADELKRLAAYHMVNFEQLPADTDKLGRSDVWWDYVYLKTPPQNSTALNVIKNQVVQGRLSSTYKPVLMLCLAEALADKNNLLHSPDAASVELPLSAITKPWERIYQKSLELDLPQVVSSPRHRSPIIAPLPDSAAQIPHGPHDIEKHILPVLRKGPFSHIIDPESGHPVFQQCRSKDGELHVRFPRAYSDAIDAYAPLVCTGAGEAVKRFLERHSSRSPEQIEAFVSSATGR